MHTELTAETLARDLREYEALLDKQVEERVLHAFIAQRKYIFDGLMRLASLTPLYSKVKLGADYEVDFAWCDNGSYGLEWRLVEIESPARPMFTKGDEPSKWLQHAIQQCRDWHDWITRNLAYAQSLLPAVEYPRCYVFVGRRSALTPTSAKRLRRLQHDLSGRVIVHTLDRLGDHLRELHRRIGPNGFAVSGRCNAYSHSELAAGQPEDAFEVYRQPFAPKIERQWREDRLAWMESEATSNTEVKQILAERGIPDGDDSVPPTA